MSHKATFKRLQREKYTGNHQYEPDTDFFDSILSGDDEQSQQVYQSLADIYSQYESDTQQYNEGTEARASKLIDNLETHATDYGNILAGIQRDVSVGLKTDSNANQFREEYAGNVASQFNATRDARRRDARSRGVDFDSSAEARELELGRAAAMANASNAAYRDWRKDYNTNTAESQRASIAHAGLYAGIGDLHQRSADTFLKHRDNQSKNKIGYTGLQIRGQEALLADAQSKRKLAVDTKLTQDDLKYKYKVLNEDLKLKYKDLSYKAVTSGGGGGGYAPRSSGLGSGNAFIFNAKLGGVENKY